MNYLLRVSTGRETSTLGWFGPKGKRATGIAVSSELIITHIKQGRVGTTIRTTNRHKVHVIPVVNYIGDSARPYCEPTSPIAVWKRIAGATVGPVVLATDSSSYLQFNKKVRIVAWNYQIGIGERFRCLFTRKSVSWFRRWLHFWSRYQPAEVHEVELPIIGREIDPDGQVTCAMVSNPGSFVNLMGGAVLDLRGHLIGMIADVLETTILIVPLETILAEVQKAN